MSLMARILVMAGWSRTAATVPCAALPLRVCTRAHVPDPRHPGQAEADPGALGPVRMLALTFRNYISAADRRVRQIILDTAANSHSPIPASFCKWMTDLMAAGFLVSYFAWFVLLCFY